MNIHNLKRMYNHILTVPEELLSMKEWRNKDTHLHKCNTVGCIIGHCVQLDDIENIPFHDTDGINFSEWSELFTGLYERSYEWDFIFDSEWARSPKTNSKQQILGRLKQFIIERNLGFGFLWEHDYSYIVTNHKFLDQTPFEL